MTEGTYEYVEEHSPPDHPRYYLDHDEYLSKKYGEGAMKGIQKEIEGMARLCNSVESNLDKDARRILFEAFDAELANLFDIEERLVDFEDELAEFEGVRRSQG